MDVFRIGNFNWDAEDDHFAFGLLFLLERVIVVVGGDGERG